MSSFIKHQLDGNKKQQGNLGIAYIGSLGMPGLRPDQSSETKRDCSRKV